MMRQYGAQRHVMIDTPRGRMAVGTVPVGTICQIDGTHGPRVIVEAWLPRDYSTLDPVTRRMSTKRIRGGHIALVRNLANGKQFKLSDVWLVDWTE